MLETIAIFLAGLAAGMMIVNIIWYLVVTLSILPGIFKSKKEKRDD